MKKDYACLGISAFLRKAAPALLIFTVGGIESVAAPAPFTYQEVATKQDAAATRAVGTVKSVAGNSIVLTLDAGGETTVLLQDGTKMVRVAPGQKDLKQATPIALSDLQPGDRILVRGKTGQDGKSLDALSLIAMAKTDLAAKQAKDREEWQRRGLGGIVSAVDPGSATITIGVTAAGEKKSVAVHLSKDTVLRRYAPDSIKFDDAKVSSLDKVQVGDQLRARGARNADGTELTADEVVSGRFRNIEGTVSSLDAGAGTMVVQDLMTKKMITVKITTESQLRKLTLPVAQRIAARLKGEAPGSAGGGAQVGSAGGQGASDGSGQRGASGPGGPAGAGAGGGRGAGGQAGDLQQLIARMPAAALTDLQKGDAVMIVSTEGTSGGTVTAITLLAGVEPILQAPGNSSLLSAWSLGGGAPGGDSGTP